MILNLICYFFRYGNLEDVCLDFEFYFYVFYRNVLIEVRGKIYGYEIEKNLKFIYNKINIIYK